MDLNHEVGEEAAIQLLLPADSLIGFVLFAG